MRNYVFDFCGTLIDKQTHELIKFYCLRYLKLGYFKKYTEERKHRLKFDIQYIENNIDPGHFADWMANRVRLSRSFELIKELIDSGHHIYIATVASERLIDAFLTKFLQKGSYTIFGSQSEGIVTGDKKADWVARLDNAIFFTDSLADEPVFKFCQEILFSEFSTTEFRAYALTHNLRDVNDFLEEYRLSTYCSVVPDLRLSHAVSQAARANLCIETTK